MQYLVKNGGAAEHHEVWRSRRRLGPMDSGVDMHGTLCRFAEHRRTYDQLVLANSAMAELLFKTLQLVKHVYDERDIDQALQSNSKVPVRAVVGGGRSASMVSPELLEHVSRELERVAAIKKTPRKLREENAAGKKGGRGEGPSKGQRRASRQAAGFSDRRAVPQGNEGEVSPELPLVATVRRSGPHRPRPQPGAGVRDVPHSPVRRHDGRAPE